MGNAGGRLELRECLKTLQEKTVASQDVKFWDKLWTVPNTALDVFRNVSLGDVRKVLKQQPDNLHTLIWQAVQQLHIFVSQPSNEFHLPALNCIRFLTRVIPAIFESIDDDPVTASFAEQVLAKKCDAARKFRPQRRT